MLKLKKKTRQRIVVRFNNIIIIIYVVGLHMEANDKKSFKTNKYNPK